MPLAAGPGRCTRGWALSRLGSQRYD